MKSILFYIHFIKIGGAEKVAMQYLDGLSNLGYNVELIIDNNMGKDGNLLEGSIPSSIKYQFIKSESVSKLIYKLRTLGKRYKLFTLLLYAAVMLSDWFYYHKKVKHMMRKNSYDVTISFYQFLPSYITRFNNCTHIIWLHGSLNHIFGDKAKFMLNQFGKKLDRYNYVVTIADEMREQIDSRYEFLRSKTVRIYNPFDFDYIRELSIQKGSLDSDSLELIRSRYICTITRLDENQKDVQTLIKAFKIVLNAYDGDIKLIIVGAGIDYLRLKALTLEYSLENDIIFVGHSVNPYVWLLNSEILVLSSKFEGLPTVLIEGMILSKFIISSDCKTGPREILHDGQCGDLFKVGDVDMLAKEILHALTDCDYTKKKVAEADEYVRIFDKSASLNDVVKLIN